MKGKAKEVLYDLKLLWLLNPIKYWLISCVTVQWHGWSHERVLLKEKYISTTPWQCICGMDGGKTPYILNVSIRWRWVVCFLLQLFYLQGKNPQFPLDGMQLWREIPLPLPGIEYPLYTWSQSLYWLSCPGFKVGCFMCYMSLKSLQIFDRLFNLMLLQNLLLHYHCQLWH